MRFHFLKEFSQDHHQGSPLAASGITSYRVSCIQGLKDRVHVTCIAQVCQTQSKAWRSSVSLDGDFFRVSVIDSVINSIIDTVT